MAPTRGCDRERNSSNVYVQTVSTTRIRSPLSEVVALPELVCPFLSHGGRKDLVHTSLHVSLTVFQCELLCFIAEYIVNI